MLLVAGCGGGEKAKPAATSNEIKIGANFELTGGVANFGKLRSEVAGAAHQLATRLAQKAEARVLGKALHKRLDDKYGRH